MTKLVTASLTSKGQLTLPKEVREILGISEKGEMVGFMIDDQSRSIRLSRVDVIPSDEDFTDEEYKKLAQLAKQKGGKSFKSMDALLRDLKKSR